MKHSRITSILGAVFLLLVQADKVSAMDNADGDAKETAEDRAARIAYGASYARTHAGTADAEAVKFQEEKRAREWAAAVKREALASQEEERLQKQAAAAKTREEMAAFRQRSSARPAGPVTSHAQSGESELQKTFRLIQEKKAAAKQVAAEAPKEASDGVGLDPADVAEEKRESTEIPALEGVETVTALEPVKTGDEAPTESWISSLADRVARLWHSAVSPSTN